MISNTPGFIVESHSISEVITKRIFTRRDHLNPYQVAWIIHYILRKQGFTNPSMFWVLIQYKDVVLPV